MDKSNAVLKIMEKTDYAIKKLIEYLNALYQWGYLEKENFFNNPN